MKFFKPQADIKIVPRRYSEVVFSDEILAGLSDEVLAQRKNYQRITPAEEIVNQIKKQRPLRVHRVKKEVRWLIKQAKKHHHDITGEIPSWLK